MASIYPNRKDGKIVSFKFKAFLGRDEDGRQIIKCTTWKPTKSMTESKLMIQADKEAAIWERKVTDEYMKSGKPKEPINTSFESFVNEIWLPAQKTDNNHRESTIAFYAYILKVVIPHIGNKKLHKITDKHIAQYLWYLTTEYKTKQGKSLSSKTIRHHYRVLNLIFGYAQKKEYIFINPMDKIEAPKLVNN
ncbi:MAG: phage integrase N-terminal SAM-like domain-containing protein, partial [Clostridia bacterium]|nr:phage integrase N-terminal SAM-like domain-containing protein [Clostridia bacterium]